MVAVMGALVAGCASKSSATSSADGVAALPVVVSGSPVADARAFQSGGTTLATARHDRLAARGPDATLGADIAGHGQVPNGGAAAMSSRPATLSTYASIPRMIGPMPATPTAGLRSRFDLPDGRVRLIYSMQGFGGPTVKSRADATRRHIDVVAADLAPIVSLVQAHLGDQGTVSPLPAESRLVITCAAASEPGVLRLLSDIDRPRRQVEISARIFEVRHDLDYQQGARALLQRVAEDGTQTALSTFSTQRLLDAAAGNMPYQGSIVSLLQTLGDSGISLDASFELLAETGLIQIVSEPRLTVAEGQTGYLLAGQELPIQSAEIINNALKASTKYKPVGVQLYVTPQLVGDATVKLHTLSIVSSVAGFTPLPTLRGDPGQRGSPLLLNPVIDSREAETNVTVAQGDTLVISGLRMVRTTTREDKIPGLGDLPILGHLFKNHRTQRQMTDLYFFLTPRMIEPGVSVACRRCDSVPPIANRSTTAPPPLAAPPRGALGGTRRAPQGGAANGRGGSHTATARTRHSAPRAAR